MIDRNLHKLGLKQEQAEALKTCHGKGLHPGRVAAATRDYCTIFTAPDQQVAARIPGRLHHEKRRQGGLLPVVGDWVMFRPARGSHSAVVHSVLPRTSCISRQAPGRRGRLVQQVIAANIDTVFIICGLDQDFNLRRIERYLALVGGGGAQGVVVLNKTDLCDSPEDYLSRVQALGCPVTLLSARLGDGLASLSPYLGPGETVALLGSSGVGKSTLVNQLLGEDRQAVAAVSDNDGKGRHTTTRRELLPLPGGAFLMDNPGMRELQLWREATSLHEAFEDILELSVQCRFNNCRHLGEPDCAVKQALESGILEPERFQSFLKLRDELDQQEEF